MYSCHEEFWSRTATVVVLQPCAHCSQLQIAPNLSYVSQVRLLTLRKSFWSRIALWREVQISLPTLKNTEIQNDELGVKVWEYQQVKAQ